MADVNVTELVARALCAREGDQWDALDAAEVAYWTGLAHAALAALDSPAVVAGIAGVLLAEQYPAHDPTECSDEWQADQAGRLARAVVDWLAGGGR